MPNVDSCPEELLAGRLTQSGPVSRGHRVMQVIVQDHVFNHAKARAYWPGRMIPEFAAQTLLLTRAAVSLAAPDNR